MKKEDTEEKMKKKGTEFPPAIGSGEEERELEILKAVAQAWHGHSAKPRPTTEFDASRGTHHRRRPSRFRVEAMRWREQEASSTWNFSHSLLDSYEILTVSKKLESNLVLHRHHPMVVDDSRGKTPRPRESENSLRRLLRSSDSDDDDGDH